MSNQDIHTFTDMVHYYPSPNSSHADLKQAITMLQRTRTLALWHDHSTILQTGYVLFAVWVVYDPAVFYTQDQWRNMHTHTRTKYTFSLL